MLERDWWEMGTVQITLEHAVGHDDYGAVQYSTRPEKLDAIVHANRRNINMGDGRVEVAQTLPQQRKK